MFITSLHAGPPPDADFWYSPIAASTSAGVSVTPPSAMSSTVVYRCVNLLAATVAKLPLKLRERATKKSSDEHPVYRVLSVRPNRWQTPYQFRAMQMLHIGLRGNAYAEIVIDRAGNVVELVPLHPDSITIEESGADWRYRHQTKTGVRVLARGQVLHLVGHCETLPYGVSPISAQSEAIGAAIAAQRYAALVFKNNARPGGGFLELPGKFSDVEARRRFMEEWHRGLTGANAHRMPVLENGMKFHELGMTNADAQMIETRKYSDTDLCRIFGVPPHKVGVLDRATYSNMEQQNVEFFEEIHSQAANLEQQLQMQLLTEEEEARYYVQFELKGVLRADSKTRAEFYNKGIQDGWMTRNEVREREDMEPLDGLDDPLEPLNMAPAGSRSDTSGDTHTDTTPDPADDRKQALLNSAAERAITRELKSVRKIIERYGYGQPCIDAVEQFYVAHTEFLSSALACDKDRARAWCAARIDRLRDGPVQAAIDLMEIEGADALRELLQ